MTHNKKTWLWIVLIAVAVIGAVILAMALKPSRTAAGEDAGTTAGGGTSEPTGTTTTEDVTEPAGDQEDFEETEPKAVPLPTQYIVLSYPVELEGDVQVHCEELEDGQLIRFTTNFTGEELQLFSFSISASGDDGFPIGVLEDEKDGSLVVCVNVEDYSDGNLKPEDFNKINAMQERVNDIIVQFYDDSRFTSIN